MPHRASHFCYTYAMFSIQHLLIGLAVLAAGIALVKYSFQAVNITGPQHWLERYTGSGSTYGMYKLLGVAMVILGLLIATGFGNNVLETLLSPLKGVFRAPGQ